MDVKIKNGDMVLSAEGSPVYTQGSEAVFQRALFCINTQRGEFRYNKDLGCSAVTSFLTEKDRENLRANLMEAVVHIEGLEVFVNSAQELVDGVKKADISLFYEGDFFDTEVLWNGRL
ncbi:MAG: hypothetical protein IKB72_04565 [Ruminococcus sp.]|nr:hypothetical protein [Ruminococcus sp.]